MRRGCETRFRSKHPRIHQCAIIWCRSTDSHLDVSTDNRATTILAHRQCPCGSTVSTEVTDHICRRFALGCSFLLSGLPCCLRPCRFVCWRLRRFSGSGGASVTMNAIPLSNVYFRVTTPARIRSTSLLFMRSRT